MGFGPVSVSSGSPAAGLRQDVAKGIISAGLGISPGDCGQPVQGIIGKVLRLAGYQVLPLAQVAGRVPGSGNISGLFSPAGCCLYFLIQPGCACC